MVKIIDNIEIGYFDENLVFAQVLVEMIESVHVKSSSSCSPIVRTAFEKFNNKLKKKMKTQAKKTEKIEKSIQQTDKQKNPEKTGVGQKRKIDQKQNEDNSGFSKKSKKSTTNTNTEKNNNTESSKNNNNTEFKVFLSNINQKLPNPKIILANFFNLHNINFVNIDPAYQGKKFRGFAVAVIKNQESYDNCLKLDRKGLREEIENDDDKEDEG